MFAELQFFFPESILFVWGYKYYSGIIHKIIWHSAMMFPNDGVDLSGRRRPNIPGSNKWSLSQNGYGPHSRPQREDYYDRKYNDVSLFYYHMQLYGYLRYILGNFLMSLYTKRQILIDLFIIVSKYTLTVIAPVSRASNLWGGASKPPGFVSSKWLNFWNIENPMINTHSLYEKNPERVTLVNRFRLPPPIKSCLIHGS